MNNYFDRWRGDGTGVLRDIGSLGVGIAGVSGAFDATPPSDREYGAETKKTLGAQIENLPTAYGAESQYQPKYGQLGLTTLLQILGGPGANTSGGLLGYLTGTVAPMMRSTVSADRAADISDAGTLARTLNPGGAGLIDKLVNQSSGALDTGMSPGELRDVQQSIRAGQAARGMGYGPTDQFDEVFGTGLAARQIRQENIRNALAAAGASQSFYGNPFELIMRGGGAGANAAGAGLSLADVLTRSSGPRLTNPESGYAASLYGQNYGGALATELENARLRSGYAQMTAKGGDSIGQALAGFI